MPGKIHGRAFELEQVNRLIQGALTGRCGMLIAEGPPGSGKSRILQEAARIAEKWKFTVSSTQARTLDAENVRMMNAAARGGLFESRNPTLVIADGVHSVTPSFMSAFQTSQTANRPPLLWMASMRTGHARPGTQPLLTAEEEQTARVELLPLSRCAVEDMVADLLGAAPDPELLAMVAGASGNPRLVVDLVEGLHDEGRIKVQAGMARLTGNQVPRRVHATVAGWLSGLSEKARQLIQVGAVLGWSFALRDIADLQSTTMASLLTALDEVLASQILVLVDDQLTFRHLLVRRTIEETIPEPVRRVLRQDVELMQTQHSHPAASPSSEHRAAPLTSRHRTPMLGTAGRLLPALLLARSSLTRPLHGGLVKDLHPALTYELAAHGGHRELTTCDAAAHRIIGLFSDDELVTRERARSVLCEGGTGAVLAATVLSNLEWARGNLAEGLSLGRDALRRVTPQVPPSWRPYPALALGAKLADIGELGEAESLIGAAQDEVDRQGGGPATADVAIARSRLLLSTGRLSHAREEAQAAVCLATDLGADWVVPESLAMLCVLALRVGDHTAASDLMWRCRMELDREYAVFPPVRYSWGEFLVMASRLEPAKAAHLLTDRYGDLLARPLLFIEDPAAAPWLVRLARSADDPSLAMAVVTAAERLAAANPQHRAVGVAAVHARGLRDRDLKALEYAIKEHPDPWASALAWEDAGLLLSAQDGPPSPSGTQNLHAALGRFDDIGALADAGRVQRELKRMAAERPPSDTPLADIVSDTPHELTDAEAQVMRLVAEGLTNSQVARRLARSPHTVNYHLRQIFKKLGISSRVELARIYYDTERDQTRA